MRTVIVYESMYGNTHHVADQIGQAMVGADVTVVAAHEVTDEEIASADLLVVGAPTHVRGLPLPVTRHRAVDRAREIPLEPDATADGVRELMGTLPDAPRRLAAAFDTRFDVSPLESGRASKDIAKELWHCGYRLLDGPESFLVDLDNRLIDGELDRAREWGAALADSLSSSLVPSTRNAP